MDTNNLLRVLGHKIRLLDTDESYGSPTKPREIHRASLGLVTRGPFTTICKTREKEGHSTKRKGLEHGSHYAWVVWIPQSERNVHEKDPREDHRS